MFKCVLKIFIFILFFFYIYIYDGDQINDLVKLNGFHLNTLNFRAIAACFHKWDEII